MAIFTQTDVPKKTLEPGPALQDELEYWAIKDPEFQGFRN